MVTPVLGRVDWFLWSSAHLEVLPILPSLTTSPSSVRASHWTPWTDVINLPPPISVSEASRLCVQPQANCLTVA